MRKSDAMLFTMAFVIATVCGPTKAISQAGTSSVNPQSSQSTQSRLDFISTIGTSDGTRTIARGQYAEEYVIISSNPSYIYRLLDVTGFSKFIGVLRQRGFTTFAFSNGTTDLLTATITTDGLANIHSTRLAPSDALAVARAEVANGKDASPKIIYLFACQVSPNATPYQEAKELIRKNDITVRVLGLLNDFLTPIHEACGRVSRGLDDPFAVVTAQLDKPHTTQQDINMLSGRARAAGVNLTFAVCGNLDDTEGLCGTFQGDRNAQYLFTKSLFSDKELSKQFAELGYTVLYIRNSAAQPNNEFMEGMRPTEDGWVALASAIQNQPNAATQTIPSPNLTKVFSKSAVSFPYPANWQVLPNDTDTQATLAPSNSENIVKMSNGNNWTLRGIEYMLPSDRIQSNLHGFSAYMVQDVWVKNDPRMKLDAPVESHVAGRPAIVVGYTTSSDVDNLKEWGLFVFFNSNKGTVILHLYCPASDQLHDKDVFDAILGHVAVN